MVNVTDLSLKTLPYAVMHFCVTVVKEDCLLAVSGQMHSHNKK
jgi:hypothetical protein